MTTEQEYEIDQIRAEAYAAGVADTQKGVAERRQREESQLLARYRNLQTPSILAHINRRRAARRLEYERADALDALRVAVIVEAGRRGFPRNITTLTLANRANERPEYVPSFDNPELREAAEKFESEKPWAAALDRMTPEQLQEIAHEWGLEVSA